MKFALLLVFCCFLMAAGQMATSDGPFINDEYYENFEEETDSPAWKPKLQDGGPLAEPSSGQNKKRSQRIYVFRRSCIRRGGSCDHRPNDCCFNSSCRCNLWGSNCRCQRAGLFQNWGK